MIFQGAFLCFPATSLSTKASSWRDVSSYQEHEQGGHNSKGAGNYTDIPSFVDSTNAHYWLMPSSLAQLEPGLLPGLICHRLQSMVPESQLSFGSLASLCTRQPELNCPNILSYSYRWSSPTPPWKSLLPQTIILFFLKGPISGWAVSAKYLALSCFMIFTVRARRALCQRKQPSHFKDETLKPAISCFVQGHGEQRGRELHLGSWLLQHCLQLHPILVLIHVKTQPKPQQILFTFRVVGFYCYFTAREKDIFLQGKHDCKVDLLPHFGY